MKHSEILKLAKKYLWDGTHYKMDNTFKSEFICNVLTGLDLSDEDFDKVLSIRKYIEKTMNKGLTKAQRDMVDCLGIQGWLNVKGYPANHGEQLQEYRQRWLDHLINQYEAVGK